MTRSSKCRYATIVLFLLLSILSGCTINTSHSTIPTTTASTQIENIYSYVFIDAMAYSSAAELVDASVMVFLGTVKKMSFVVLDYDTGRMAEPNDSNANCGLFTLYEIQVNTLYKGADCETVTLALSGGVGGQEYKEEQLELLESYGLAPKIQLINHNKKHDIGGQYLFTLKYRDGWSTYFCGTTIGQFSFQKDEFGWEYEDVLAYFAHASEE